MASLPYVKQFSSSTDFLFASPPGSRGATDKITFCFAWGRDGSQSQGDRWAGHTLFTSFVLPLLAGRAVRASLQRWLRAGRGCLSSKPGAMFPSAYVPMLVLACVSLGRMSVFL